MDIIRYTAQVRVRFIVGIVGLGVGDGLVDVMTGTTCCEDKKSDR